MHKTDDLAVVAQFKNKLNITVRDTGRTGDRLKFSVVVGDQKFAVWMSWAGKPAWSVALLTPFEARGTIQERFSHHTRHENLEAAFTFLSTVPVALPTE